jgi:hypothetical protein
MLRDEIAAGPLRNEGEGIGHGGGGFFVRVLDLFHFMKEDEEMEIGPFPTIELAREYARKRTGHSMDEHSADGSTHGESRTQWLGFGESCVVIGDSDDGARQRETRTEKGGAS